METVVELAFFYAAAALVAHSFIQVFSPFENEDVIWVASVFFPVSIAIWVVIQALSIPKRLIAAIKAFPQEIKANKRQNR